MEKIPSYNHERGSMGATLTSSGVFFRVYAPDHFSVEVEFDDNVYAAFNLTATGDGYFSGTCPDVGAGARYRFRLSGNESHPDPYSRFQPSGPHGPSLIVDPDVYRWHDAEWTGLDPTRQIVYELHIGTFTDAGTYEGAAQHLTSLRDLGITCLEIMPVNEFVGQFGWGYDGVNWFAPFHHYGHPEDLRAFVDQAHQVGLGVILDVVYNHFGHDGNYLPRFAADYVTSKFENPWGAAPNYECEAMRRLVIDNAVYWISEFHLDGFRLDAIQSIHDPVYPTLLRSLVSAARTAAGSRRIIIAAEDLLQRTSLVGTGIGVGADINHLWNDDFHHACRVAMTGNHYGFFKNYRGTSQEILSCLKRGFLYQGQYDAWSDTERGLAVRDEPLTSFVAFTQNHDAVANTLHGRRLHSFVSPGKYRALTAVLLLGPQTPLIFMGQEFGASTPFAYFADYPAEAGSLWNARKLESKQFLQYQDARAQAKILNPCSADTVRASALKHAEKDPFSVQLFTDLIALRKGFGFITSSRDVEGAVLNDTAFVLRWFGQDGADRLLLVNMASQLEMRAWAEPLLAAPLHRRWQQLWSSDSPEYGGMGAVDAYGDKGWQMSAESACLLLAIE